MTNPAAPPVIRVELVQPRAGIVVRVLGYAAAAVLMYIVVRTPKWR